METVPLLKAEILYAKSKTYLHPTTSKKDNIPGFLLLCRPGNASTAKDVLLSFTPESMLSKDELRVYEEADISDELADEILALLLAGPKQSRKAKQLAVVNKPPQSVGSDCAFSIPLSYVYLIQFRTPSLGWWYGSIIVHTKSGDKLPVVFFHDDESPLTLQKQKIQNQRFDPFGADGQLYWGGLDFLLALQHTIHVDRSTVEPSVYLVDPLLADMANFAMPRAPKQPKPAEFKLPDVSKLLATAKWRVLETVATFGLRTKHQVVDLVDEHVPAAVVRLVASTKEAQKLGADFDLARVYLAKWAAQVKEEAETAQRRFMLEDAVYARINAELGLDDTLLTPEEVSRASRRKPVSQVEWAGLFDRQGRLTVTVDEVKSRIFHGGVCAEARKDVWPFLLGVFPWDSSAKDRETILDSLRSGYCDYKRRWADDEDKRLTEFWKDQKVRIEKDIHRNDRSLAIFLKKREEREERGEREGGAGGAGGAEARESLPETPDSDAEWDLAHISNVHLFRMREILLTYNEYNVNLGYVQGMTDLLLPIYVVFQNETMAFWAFTAYMERMERNFVRDQSGMKRQMVVLNELVQFMLPSLFRHLAKCEATDLFFFFRMLLVWYKREFEWDDVNTLWEVLWTDYYLSQYHLFVALAVLSDNERIIMQNLLRFDEVLKYMNDLLGKMNLHDILVRAELLFLRFRRMIDVIDRENLLKPLEDLYEVHVNPDLRELLSKKLVVQKEVERPEGVGGG